MKTNMAGNQSMGRTCISAGTVFETICPENVTMYVKNCYTKLKERGRDHVQRYEIHNTRTNGVLQ
jgi:hypothetical protein